MKTGLWEAAAACIGFACGETAAAVAQHMGADPVMQDAAREAGRAAGGGAVEWAKEHASKHQEESKDKGNSGSASDQRQEHDKAPESQEQESQRSESYQEGQDFPQELEARQGIHGENQTMSGNEEDHTSGKKDGTEVETSMVDTHESERSSDESSKEDVGQINQENEGEDYGYGY